MLINFHVNVVNQREHFPHLDRILTRIADGAHDWQIGDIEEIEGSEWHQHMKPYEREVFEKAAKAASYPYTGLFRRKLQVCHDLQSADQLPPVQAAYFVDQPLKILMENEFTDGQLLKIAMEFLAPPLLWQLHQNPLLKLILFIGVGGIGEMPKMINRALAEAKNTNTSPRFLVFTDSDGVRPGDIHKNAQIVKSECAQTSIPCCILQKRAIENYIPDSIFQEYIKRDGISYKAKIDILLQMTTNQRDYFSIKSGFGQKKPVEHDDQLFNSLNERKVEWSKGLGDEVIHWLEKYKSALTAQALQERDHHSDLSQIIGMILDQL